MIICEFVTIQYELLVIKLMKADMNGKNNDINNNPDRTTAFSECNSITGIASVF